MRWIAVVVLACTLGASTAAFAAGLEVSSEKLTVFTNTLATPTVSVAPVTQSVTVGGLGSASASLSGATDEAGGTITYKVYSGE